MRLDIPFQYRATYLERGRRSQSACYLESVAYVDVREVPPETVSVAFLVADASGNAPGLGPVGGRARRIVSHGGRLWRELMDATDLKALVEARMDDAEAAEDRRHDNPFAVPGRETLGWVPGLVPRTPAEVEAETRGIRAWMDDAGAARTADIQLRANRIIVSRGVAFELTDEPCWEVAEEEHEVVVRLATWGGEAAAERKADLALQPWQRGAASRDRCLFNIARVEDAILCAREIGTLPNPPAQRVRVAARAKVIAPGEAVFADDCLALEQAAARLWGEVKSYLPTLERAQGRVCVGLRDALADSGGRACPALAAALTAITDIWEAEPGQRPGIRAFTYDSRHEHPGHVRSERALAAAMACAWVAGRRWMRRPDNGLEWSHLADFRETADGALSVHEISTLSEARETGLTMGVDLSAEAADVAAGRSRLFLASEGGVPAAFGVADPGSGTVVRMVGRGGRPPSRNTVAVISRHAEKVFTVPAQGLVQEPLSGVAP